MSDWPLLLEFARQHQGEPLALASLVATEGSSYRKPGARLLISADGGYCGSLSGGCLEDGIARAAREVIASGLPRTDWIDTRPHFGCPGQLQIFTESLNASNLLGFVSESLASRQSFALQTTAAGTRPVRDSSREGFVEEVTPFTRLIAVGGTSDLEPVFAFGQTLGWECLRVLSDRRVASSVPSMSGEKVVTVSAPDLLESFHPDDQTAVLIMSHHLATDLAYLRACVGRGYGYLGLLGSRRRRETLLSELGEQGLLENCDWTQKFHAPVGLDLGATHPTSIALAIVAEIQAVLAGRSGGFLRERVEPIHLHHPAS